MLCKVRPYIKIHFYDITILFLYNPLVYKSSKYQDERCLIVGFSLEEEEIYEISEMGQHVLFLEFETKIDLKHIMLNAWCVRSVEFIKSKVES